MPDVPALNRPKASQAKSACAREGQGHQMPAEGAGRDEDRYRGGGEEAETSEALPLVKTHSDTEQDCALGNCRHLAEAVLL